MDINLILCINNLTDHFLVKNKFEIILFNYEKLYYPCKFLFLLQLAKTLESLDKNDKIGCIVLTGGTRAFAGTFNLSYHMHILMLFILAGADIKEMQNHTMPYVLNSDFPEQLSAVSKIKKPIIAAVNGFAVYFSFLSRSIFPLSFVSQVAVANYA